MKKIYLSILIIFSCFSLFFVSPAQAAGLSGRIFLQVQDKAKLGIFIRLTPRDII